MSGADVQSPACAISELLRLRSPHSSGGCSGRGDQGRPALVPTAISAGPPSLPGAGPEVQVLLRKPIKPPPGECYLRALAGLDLDGKALTWMRGKQSVEASGPKGAGLNGKVGHLSTYLRTGERQTGLLKRRMVLLSLTSGP